MMAVEQRGRVAMLGAGDLVLYDSTSPFLLTYPGDNQGITLKLPMALLAQRLPDVRDCTALCIQPTGMGALAGAMLSSFIDHLDEIGQGERSSTVHSLLDMIASAVQAETRGDDERKATPEKLRQIAQIQQWMLARLGDADLNASTIAAAHGVTPRTLSRLFAIEDTTPIRWLNQRRLEAAHRAISSGAVSRITEACFAVGFNDFSHFGRSFRRMYGLCPSDLMHRIAQHPD